MQIFVIFAVLAISLAMNPGALVRQDLYSEGSNCDGTPSISIGLVPNQCNNYDDTDDDITFTILQANATACHSNDQVIFYTDQPTCSSFQNGYPFQLGQCYGSQLEFSCLCSSLDAGQFISYKTYNTSSSNPRRCGTGTPVDQVILKTPFCSADVDQSSSFNMSQPTCSATTVVTISSYDAATCDPSRVESVLPLTPNTCFEADNQLLTVDCPCSPAPPQLADFRFLGFLGDCTGDPGVALQAPFDTCFAGVSELDDLISFRIPRPTTCQTGSLLEVDVFTGPSCQGQASRQPVSVGSCSPVTLPGGVDAKALIQCW